MAIWNAFLIFGTMLVLLVLFAKASFEVKGKEDKSKDIKPFEF